jgi:protein TonB
MSRQARHIAGFLALSAAGHAAVLLLASPPKARIDPERRPVSVMVTYREGALAGASPADTSARSTRTAREPPRRTGRATPARKPARRPSENPMPHNPGARPHPPRQTENRREPGPTATASAERDTTRQGSGEQLRKHILELVNSRFTYPLLARRKGWQGVVKLQVHVEADGRISGLRVQATSGYAVLDEAALNSLRLASVPDAERWLKGHALDIIIPVEYRLVGG